MDNDKTRSEQGPDSDDTRKPYVAPRVTVEEQFEGHALACANKDATGPS